METVLVVGASGNIGVSAIIGALRRKMQVIAIVRNQNSAEKIFKHVGTKENITIVEGDVLSDHCVENVLAKVKAGQLPAFQHVYATIGTIGVGKTMHETEVSEFSKIMSTSIGGNYFAYRATIPYLLEHGGPKATWTLMTGAAGEVGILGVSGMTQGALFSMATAASRELENTNIRFNEQYLAFRVEYDSQCDDSEANAYKTKASDFARSYEHILENENIRGCRVNLKSPTYIDELDYKKKVVPWKR